MGKVPKNFIARIIHKAEINLRTQHQNFPRNIILILITADEIQYISSSLNTNSPDLFQNKPYAISSDISITYMPVALGSQSL